MITIRPDGTATIRTRCPDCGLFFTYQPPKRPTYCGDCRPRRNRESTIASQRRAR